MSSPRLLARSLLAAAAAFAVCLAELPGLTGAAFELDDFSIFHPMFGAGTTISSPADLAGRNCLRWQQLSAAISRQRWGVGTGLSLRGTGRHQEASTWLGAGLSPMPALALGTGIHVLQLRQGHSPSVRAITLSAGVRLKIGANVRLNAWLHGPARDLAQPRMLLSLSRILGDQSALQGYLTRRGGRQGGANRLHLGAATPINPRLWLLLGARSAPIQFAAGSRIEAGVHFLEYRVDTHAVLGTSHAALVGRSCGPSL